MDNLTAPTSTDVHHCARCKRPYRGVGFVSSYSPEHTVCALCARNEKYEIQGVFPPCDTPYWELVPAN